MLFFLRSGSHSAAILCINWIRQESQNQHLPHISLPIIEELHTLQVDENAEETIQNEVYNTKEHIQNQSSKSDESDDDESDSNKILKVFSDFSSTWFSDFQNTNSLTLQEQEFHTNCHTVLKPFKQSKRNSKFF